MSAVLSSNVEVLPAARPAAAVQGPGDTVIDANTGTITFEHKGRDLLLAEANVVYDDAKDLAPLIDSDAMYQEGAELLKKVTDSHKTLDEKRLETTKPLRDKVEEINDDYKPAIQRLKDAGELIKQGMLTYDRRVEAERQEAERQARVRAEEERRRAAEEAEAARRRAAEEAEATRKQAEEDAAAARAAAEEKAAGLRKEAEQLDAAGNFARAEQLRAEARELLGEAEEVVQTTMFAAEQQASTIQANAQVEAEALTNVAQMVTPQAVSIARPRAAGVSTRKVYAARINDPKAALAHILANWDTCNHLVELLQAKFDRLASDQKERFSFPGCELTTENAISSRRR